MNIYVLIHGAWHGGWCWTQVTPLLEQQGHAVYTPDLPGHGSDDFSAADITLQSYVDAVCEIVDSQPEPVILVGHSMGGMVIAQVAEARPHQIRSLVYLAAFLPRDGEVSNHLVQQAPTSQVPANVMSKEGTLIVRNEALVKVFYGRCTEADVQYALARLVPEPLTPTNTPVHLTVANYGRVPRVYIECVQDQAIPLSLQRQMQHASPCDQVLTLETDHSPFFSMPRQLADLLLQL